MKIAVLGATGYIGRSLLAECAAHGLDATGFSRDPARAERVLVEYGIPGQVLRGYNVFEAEDFGIVVNAAGIGSPRELAKDLHAVVVVTEDMDARIASYAEQYPAVRVFNISSGVVSHERDDPYALAKRASEAAHRARPDLAITDLRVFAFMSAYLSLEDTFFLSEVVRAIVEKTKLVTGAGTMIRDVITPPDLLDAMLFLHSTDIKNDVFDLVTPAPFEKFELLAACEARFGLQWRIEDNEQSSPTGPKNVYASTSDKLARAGFVPHLSATEGVLAEIEKFLKLRS